MSLSSQTASGQPLPEEPSQWKESIERPVGGWDYDGKRILGHIGYDICLWDAESGELLHRMKGHKERIHSVQFSPDGHHALSSSWIRPGPMQPGRNSKDTSTILWNLGTGRARDIFKGEVAGEFSPDGKRFVTFTQRLDKQSTTYSYTNSETGEVRRVESIVPVERFDNAAVWETYTGRQLVEAKLDEYSTPYSDTLHFSPDGDNFVYLVYGKFRGSGPSGGIVFNTSDGREIGRIGGEDASKGHRYTSNRALAIFQPTRARLIDFESGREIRNVKHDLNRTTASGTLITIGSTVWTHDGSKVVVIPPGGKPLKILDMNEQTLLTGALTHPAGSSPAIVSPDNSCLAIESGSNPKDNPQVRLYPLNTGEEIARLDLSPLGRQALIGFSPDSKTLLIGGSEFVIHDAESGEKIRTLKLLDEIDEFNGRSWQ